MCADETNLIAFDYATCCRRSQIDDGASATAPVFPWCGLLRGRPAPVFSIPAFPAPAIVGVVDLARPAAAVLWAPPRDGRSPERAHRLQARVPPSSAGRRIRGNDDARLLRLRPATEPEDRTRVLQGRDL